jgi:hypothetical protein
MAQRRCMRWSGLSPLPDLMAHWRGLEFAAGITAIVDDMTQPWEGVIRVANRCGTPSRYVAPPTKLPASVGMWRLPPLTFLPTSYPRGPQPRLS